MQENRDLIAELEARNQHITRLNDELQQHVADATRGLVCCHDILEAADVGIVTIDADGMVVGANGRAVELLSEDSPGMIGLPAERTLPEEVMIAVGDLDDDRGPMPVRRLSVGGHTYQWRGRPLSDVTPRQGLVIAFWREAA